MKETSLQGSDIFAIQTHYDGSWRSDRKFISERQAQIHANLLIGDWGRQRVRLLKGRYDAVCDHRRYSPIDIAPPKSKFARITENLIFFVRKTLSPVKRIPLFGALTAFAIIIGVSGVTSYPLLASGKNAEQPIANAEAPIAKNVRVVFVSLLKGQLRRLVTLKEVPVRLHGDWSQFCPSGIQDLQISHKSVTEFDGAIATDSALQAVFQAGQTYGLIGTSGDIQVIEMAGIDLVKPLGKINISGEFEAIADAKMLKRCL
ncbi:MAG: hypothetical protein V7750_19425 [Sneathiella sp.]